MQMLAPFLVESLFARLLVSWGQAFLRQYDGVDLAAVQADWAEKLAVFQRRGTLPDDEPTAPAIDWALDRLPPKAMNVIEFRAFCNSYVAVTNTRALAGPPRAVPERFRAALALLAKPLDDQRPEAVRVACRFIKRWGANGEKLTPRQKADLAHYRRIVEGWEADERRHAPGQGVAA